MISLLNAESKRRALEALAGEFSFKTWSSGHMLVPEDALPRLAREDISFKVEDSTAYEKLATLRSPAASGAPNNPAAAPEPAVHPVSPSAAS